jgi:hypothetical protein
VIDVRVLERADAAAFWALRLSRFRASPDAFGSTGRGALGATGRGGGARDRLGYALVRELVDTSAF